MIDVGWPAASNHGLGLFGQSSSETATVHKAGSSLLKDPSGQGCEERGWGLGRTGDFLIRACVIFKNTQNYSKWFTVVMKCETND